MLSFGEKLRSERERRETTLEQIAEATRIDLSYLEALERNRFEALPGRNFGKLYIRAYAELLGFDATPLIADYDLEQLRQRREKRGLQSAPQESEESVEEPEPLEATPAEPEPVQVQVQEPVPRRPLPIPALLATGLVVAAVWIGSSLIREEERAASDPARGPASTAQIETPPVVEPSLPAPSEEIEPQPAVAEAARAASRLSVADFGIGRRIVNRRLVDRGDRFEEGTVVFFSTRVIGGEAGERIRHVWFREGRAVQRVDLEVGGPHWRTHSRKTLWGVGNWAVEARDPEGQLLARTTFSCVARS